MQKEPEQKTPQDEPAVRQVKLTLDEAGSIHSDSEKRVVSGGLADSASITAPPNDLAIERVASNRSHSKVKTTKSTKSTTVKRNRTKLTKSKLSNIGLSDSGQLTLADQKKLGARIYHLKSYTTVGKINRKFAQDKHCLLYTSFAENKDDLLQESQVTLTVLEDAYFSDSNVESNPLLASHARDLWANASAALLSYIESTQLVLPKHIESIAPYEIQTYMLLDSAARLNLELTETIRERSRKGSLLATIDRTKTAMGGRLLRRWLLQPLIDKRDIETRQTMVARFHEDFVIRQTLRESLDGLFDLERLAGRIALGRVTPKDLLALADVLLLLPEIKATLESLPDEEFTSLSAMITPLDDLASWLKSALVDDPPLIVGDRQLIRDGFDPDMDALRDALTNGRQWLVDLEQKEREKTSIKNLKAVSYTHLDVYKRQIPDSGYIADGEQFRLDLIQRGDVLTALSQGFAGNEVPRINRDGDASRWLQLPAIQNLQATVAAHDQTLHDLVYAQPNLSQTARVLAIRERIAETFSYNLEVPAPEANREFVTWFFETKEGYCTYFATTYACLLYTSRCV